MSLPMSSIVSGGLALGGDGSIKPSSILDCADVVGTAGQVLSSTGTTLEWITPASVSSATPTVEGIIFGCTDTGALSASAALGECALSARTTGCYNTAIGVGALVGTTSGNGNTSLGYFAGNALTTECNNVSIGTNAGLNCGYSNSVLIGAGAVGNFNANGTDNVIVGYSAMSPAFIGSALCCSVVIGTCALSDTTYVGSQNVAIGPNISLRTGSSSCELAIGFATGCYWLTGECTKAIRPGGGIIDCTESCGFSGQYLTTTGTNDICWGSIPYATPSAGGLVYGFWSDISDPYQQCGNLAYGPQAMETWYSSGDINSNRNTAFGFKALASGGASGNTTINNVAIGLCALAAATTPWRNVAIGAYAAQLGSPSQSVFIGNEAGYCGSPTNAVIIGAYAGGKLSTGNDSVIIGSYAGCCITSGSGNILVGTSTGCLITSGSGNILIGCGNSVGLTTGSSNIVIGNGSATSSATVSNEVTISNGCATNGTARFQGTAGAWSFSSDVRKKENITALPVGREFINDLQPRSFSWCATQEESAGFIAQEVDEVVEKHSAEYLRLVNKEDPDSWMLAQTNMIPVLVKALQELDQELTNLKKEFNDYRSTHP